MIEKRLIIVDDDPIILEVAKVAFASKTYQIFTTTSPKEALKEFIENPTLVVLSDLNMPGMSGVEFLNELKKLPNTPVFIILTSQNDISTAVELFQSGVHDYILKPFSGKELAVRMDKAFEYAEMKLISENIVKERETRIEHQLNWNLFKEGLIKKDTDRSDSGLMTSINSSLVQGAGLGALSPLVQLMKETSTVQGEFYLVEKELLDTLFDTTKFSDKLIYIIGDIDYVINNDLVKERTSLTDIKKIIQEVIDENQEFIKLKEHQVKLSESNLSLSSETVDINDEYFRKAIKELILNALKFSEANTKIYFLFEISKDIFNISILNSPLKDTLEGNGIQKDFQTLIFEPFFRIVRTVHEEYGTLDFGLGLTFVEKIIRNHGGKIRITNLKNFLENNNSNLVSFTIELPYSKK